jgi:hypothetical protein
VNMIPCAQLLLSWPAADQQSYKEHKIV